MERGQFNDYNDILYYSNLESEDDNKNSQSFGQNPQFTLGKYLSVLKTYSKILSNKANSLKFDWQLVAIPDDYGEAKDLFAIKLNPSKGNEKNYNNQESKEILQQISKQTIRGLKYYEQEKKKNQYIEIVDVYDEGTEDDITLIVNKLPDGPIVFPDLNDLSLKREIEAITKLEDRPEEYLLPLLRLAGQNSDKIWSKPDLVDVMEWRVLNDATFPGINDQRKMVRQALSTNDFAILEGPPGSGKTTVLSELILQLLLAKKRVLLVGSTHVAVDNVLEKIIKYTNIVVPIRIAPLDMELSPEIMDLTYNKYVKSFKKKVLMELLKLKDKNDIQKDWINEIQTDKNDIFISQIINDSINLVSGTTFGVLQFPEIKNCIKNKTFKPLFDVMIIDEASKTNFTEFLVPAMFAKKWIISGDPKQLSPYTDRDLIVSEINSLLEDEYKNAPIPYSDLEKVSLLAFWANNVLSSGRKDAPQRALLVLDDHDWKLQKAISEQINNSKVETIIHVIPETVKSEETEKIMINGSDVIIANSKFIQKYADALPYGTIIHGNMISSKKMEFRNQFYFKALKLNHSSNVAVKDSKLSDEIAWRLIRYYEMRMSVKKALQYKEEIRDLIPKAGTMPIDKGNKKIVDYIWDKLDKIKYTIFPSILETLISGNSNINSNYRGSILESGFSKEYKNSIWTLLSYQYRMHIGISYYPRKLVYTSEDGISVALKDTDKIDREWNFKRYQKRIVWLDVERKNSYSKKIKRQNVNDAEAEKIIEELKKFVEFAAEDTSEKHEWSVAIMSFYANQTILLKNKIRKQFEGKGSVYYNKDKSVKIFVGNVDAMQGREADIVYLSMVRTGGLGFLDNMNRINVAITRARYQLVIVGNHRVFSTSKKEDALVHRLAIELTPNYEL
jgi:hypothetical protein